MSRYVQPVSTLDDPYAGDPLLRSWLERQLGPAGHAAAKDRLADLAADVAGPLRAAHADAEAHPPTLVRYDPWGARVDRIDSSAGWQAQRAAAARHAVVALPYEAGRPRGQAPHPGSLSRRAARRTPVTCDGPAPRTCQEMSGSSARVRA